MKTEYELSIFDTEGYKELAKSMKKLSTAITSKDFMNFIAGKCMQELSRISNERLSGIPEDDVAYAEIAKYRTNHVVDIGDDYVIVSNETMADLSHLSPKTMANYPEGLSISMVIEFGTGIWGSDNSEFGWETEVNSNRDYSKGWYYEKDGAIHFSKGIGGKFIYYEVLQVAKEKMEDWLWEYIEKI